MTFRSRAFTSILLVTIAMFLGISREAFADTAYRRDEIAKARFGDATQRELLKKVRRLKGLIGETVVGQESVAQAMQDRFVQYVEQWGGRSKEPMALHLIGLPGIGKSALLDVIGRIGVPVFRIEAQQFESADGRQVMWAVHSVLKEVAEKQKETPVVLLIDEIDKLREVASRGGSTEEKTNPLIGGVLNPLLSEGKIPNELSEPHDLSNVFVITAMNFDPVDIQAFAQQGLGAPKDYYDFSVQDLLKFHEWVTARPGAITKVLSRLFRSNTISRLAPNTVIAKPLTEENYRDIVKLTLDRAIKQQTTGKHEARRVTVRYTDALVDFLQAQSMNPPIGAREVVLKVDLLASQLMSFGEKARGGDSLNRPRDLLLDYHQTHGRAEVTITPRAWHQQTRTLVEQPSFSIEVKYDRASRSFVEPAGIAIEAPKPTSKLAGGLRSKPITQKQVLQARYPMRKRPLKGLAKAIDGEIFGQQEISKMLAQELGTFLARSNAPKVPSFVVLAGFPGIGKSEIARLSLEHAGLPIVRVNLQAYSSDDPDVLSNFRSAVSSALEKARRESPSGKVGLVFEELDKIFEMDPITGTFVNRPIMNVIKDLVDKGTTGNGGLDIRDAFTVFTMNFAVERFGFSADPRLTTIEDVQRAWKLLSTRPNDRKRVLGSMFLPETVNRIFDRVHILKPLGAKDYEKVISAQLGQVVAERLIDPTTKQNIARIEVEMTPAYRRYLYDESVIPSEGARNTANRSRGLMARDLEQALEKLPGKRELAAAPLVVTLHFRPGRSEVVASVRRKAALPGERSIEIYARPETLQFPPMALKRGRLPEQRLQTAVHEFGHAYAAVLLGKRVEYATVIPPSAGIGGYVKHKRPEGGAMTAKGLLSTIYMALASRAMERIFLSTDPRSPLSVIDITTGSSQDMETATGALVAFLYELGLDPKGGTLTRSATPSDALSHEETAQLKQILRDMENHLVETFLAAHPLKWYRDKIVKFARAGGATEKEFYQILGYANPGESARSAGELSKLYEHFKGVIQNEPRGLGRARRARLGAMRKTPAENMEAAVTAFLGIIGRRLHKDGDALAREAMEGLRTRREVPAVRQSSARTESSARPVRSATATRREVRPGEGPRFVRVARTKGQAGR